MNSFVVLCAFGASMAACQDAALVSERKAERPPAQPRRDRGVGPFSSTGGSSPHAGAPSGGATTAQVDFAARFAVVGDYGWSGDAERRVAELVTALDPDYVLTTGDNNYPDGAAATIDANVGQYFSRFIAPYRGAYGAGATVNRFFPVLGNHDWDTAGAAPYLEYFSLPGNERYYDVVLGSVHFFALDSDAREPDGVDSSSRQASWLRAALARSRSPFRVVAMHHPPFSSGPHGSSTIMQWPYREWGVDLVLAGHDHGYERLQVGGVTYVVSGLGGASIYSFGVPLPGSLVRYSAAFGTALLDVDASALRLSFVDVDGQVIDTATIGVAR